MTVGDIIANEKNFLGCLLRSSHEFWAVNDKVGPEMFTEPHHREIYTAIRFLAESGRQVTFPALQASLPEEFEERGPTIALLQVLRANAEDAGSATDYVENIAQQSAQRRLAELAKWLSKEAKNPDHAPEEVAGELALRAQHILSQATPARPVGIGEITSRIVRSDGKKVDQGVVSGLDTGIIALDDILGRMLGGDLGFIIASQGDGKSALAAQIGMHVARSGRPVLYVQLEMSPEQMGVREIAALTNVEVGTIDERSFDFAQHEAVIEASRALKDVPFYILDEEEITVRQVRAQALAMQRGSGLSLIIIDQLDKLKPEQKHRDIFERAAEVTNSLKGMAKGLKVPTICLAQRTRGAQRRDDPTPHVLDCDARSIERDADWVIGLWQKVNWLRMNPPASKAGGEQWDAWETKCRQAEGFAEVISLKHRRRKPFQQRRVKFDGAVMRFSEAE